MNFHQISGLDRSRVQSYRSQACSSISVTSNDHCAKKKLKCIFFSFILAVKTKITKKKLYKNTHNTFVHNNKRIAATNYIFKVKFPDVIFVTRRIHNCKTMAPATLMFVSLFMLKIGIFTPCLLFLWHNNVCLILLLLPFLYTFYVVGTHKKRKRKIKGS